MALGLRFGWERAVGNRAIGAATSLSRARWLSRTRRRWLLVAAAIALTGPPALAQQAPVATAQPDTVLAEIIVTGSRIAAPNEVSTSPIVSLSNRYIEVSGKTDISDIITSLPQNFTNDLGQDLGNGTSGLSTPGGVSTADLRGLGPNRTLVLVDGRRLGQGSPNTAIQSPAPDLDQIPSGLVERVEVVTGGASAAYGSDAIAGVVNFIMKRNFEGFQVDGQYNENQHNNGNEYLQGLVRGFNNSQVASGNTTDGRQRNFDMIMGTNFADGKGNITAFLSYRHADPVAGSQRDFGGCQLNAVQDANNNVIGTSCGGSSNSNYFFPASGPNVTGANPPLAVYSVHGTGFVPFGSVLTTPPAAFNSQPYIYMTREDDRYNAAFLAQDKVTDSFQPYADFYFMDDRTHTQIAPAALFRSSDVNDPTGLSNYNVNCDNPLLSGQQRGILCSPAQLAYVGANPGQRCVFNTDASGNVSSPNCANVEIGRRNIEGGGRFANFEHENYRAVFGTKGDFLDDAWSYDAYGQYYYTTFFNSNNKFLSFANIDNALQVTGTAANPKCISGGACVPYNIWSDGGVTQQALNYLYLLGTSEGTSTLRTLHAEVTGQLGKYGITSPLATDGIGVNVGFEHRNDQEFFQPDSAEQSGQLSGFGSASVPIDNSLAVKEGFAEVRAPLVQDKPFAKDLLFDTGYRYSDYSTNVKTHTYKFELQYAPIADYRFRASYDKAIRAPSVIELYNPQLVALIQYGNDPCAPPITFTLQQCLRTGVTATQYQQKSIPQVAAGQMSELSGGNTALSPEQAETYTFGVNFAPSQVPGLTGSIDYYHISITDEITTIPASIIINNCANTGDPTYCTQIVRARNGALNGSSIANGGYLVQTNVNAGAALASGIDLQLAYKFDLPAGWGGLAFDMNGTYVQHFESTPLPGQHTYDCAGLFGKTCQTISPRRHHIFRTTWMTPWDVSASATWRYIGKVGQDNNDPDPSLQYATWGGYDLFNSTISAYNYLDLEATWHVNKILTVRVGANNVMDKDPPVINNFIVGGGAANTYSIYDMFGRQLFAAFTAKF